VFEGKECQLIRGSQAEKMVEQYGDVHTGYQSFNDMWQERQNETRDGLGKFKTIFFGKMYKLRRAVVPWLCSGGHF